MNLINKAGGWVELELISACFQDTLQIINEAGCELYGVQQKDFLTGSFWVKRTDCESVIFLCEKNEGKTRIIRKTGVYWLAKKIQHRPILIIGAVLTLLLTGLLPSRILFVRVEGNAQVPERQILAAAENCGIAFGASRRTVRSEKVKNALLSAVPQLQWAGVNTSGCVATISVRERVPEENNTKSTGVSNIVADRDGFILSASATKGTLLVAPGQSIQAGQMLISGYTDCGISIRAEHAEGEVYAQTNRNLQIVAPSDGQMMRHTGDVRKKISLLIGKKRINLWKDSGISLYSCGRMYSEYYVTLPGGFQLPVALCIERYPEYSLEKVLMEQDALQTELTAFAKGYLKQQMSAGEILRETTYVDSQSDQVRFDGSYVCRELIGRVQMEQIGEVNGKNGGTNREC